MTKKLIAELITLIDEYGDRCWDDGKEVGQGRDGPGQASENARIAYYKILHFLEHKKLDKIHPRYYATANAHLWSDIIKGQEDDDIHLRARILYWILVSTTVSVFVEELFSAFWRR
jgi:hypothetical protein